MTGVCDSQEWDADEGRGGSNLRFLTDSLGTNIVGDIRSNLRSLDDNSNSLGLKEKQSLIPVTIIFPKVKKMCFLVFQLALSYGTTGKSLELCSSLDRCAVCNCYVGCQKNSKSLSYFIDEEAEIQRENVMDKFNNWLVGSFLQDALARNGMNNSLYCVGKR